MGVEIRVPSLGESVAEATVAKWFKQIGDTVTEDEQIVAEDLRQTLLEMGYDAFAVASSSGEAIACASQRRRKRTASCRGRDVLADVCPPRSHKFRRPRSHRSRPARS